MVNRFHCHISDPRIEAESPNWPVDRGVDNKKAGHLRPGLCLEMVKAQILSEIEEPDLNGPVAVLGGRAPEHTGLPYLSKRWDR